MFQFQMVVNNQTSELSEKRDILFIEHIAFLLQTLTIKIQFSHFLKLTNFIQHIGKILNQSVNEVHYIFQEGPLITQNFHLFDDFSTPADGAALLSSLHQAHLPLDSPPFPSPSPPYSQPTSFRSPEHHHQQQYLNKLAVGSRAQDGYGVEKSG